MDRKAVEQFIYQNFSGFTEEYPWEKTPNYAVFRHQDNHKWFALLYEINYSTIIRQNPQLTAYNFSAKQSPRGKVSAINLKSDPDLIEDLTYAQGILPAYHMNKRHWLTILLDGSCPDAEIAQLIALSYRPTAHRPTFKMIKNQSSNP